MYAATYFQRTDVESRGSHFAAVPTTRPCRQPPAGNPLQATTYDSHVSAENTGVTTMYAATYY